MHNNPIVLRERLAYPVIAAGKESHQTLLCSLSARDETSPHRPPLCLMLCIDTSGSMMGRPLELIVKSVEMLLNKLDQRDQLGMVSFSNRAKLISSLRNIDDQGKAFYQGVLQSIQAIGSTNMEAGLRLSLEQLSDVEGEALTHLILFSDGQPNRGETDPSKLASRLTRIKDRSSFSFLGFGDAHNEDLLQQMAQESLGGYAYIESAETIPLAFAKELGGLMSIVATDVQLFLRPLFGCSILKLLNNLQTRYTERGFAVTLPDMIAGAEFHLFFELSVNAPEQYGAQQMAELELRYCLAGQHKQQIAQTRHLEYVASNERSAEMDAVAATRLLLYQVAQAWEEAHKLAQSARYADAISLLQSQQLRLRSAPGFRERKGEIRNWYEQIIDEIAVLSEAPRGERYQQVRKVVKSEMSDPSGIFRRSNTSFANLNTTQRHLLNDLMLKAVGIPHAYLQIESIPADSPIENGHIFPILGEVSIGRMGQIQIDHHSIGKLHLRLIATPDGYLAIDLLSTNPPAINGKPLLKSTRLFDADLIQLGEFTLRFRLGLAPSLQLQHPRPNT